MRARRCDHPASRQDLATSGDLSQVLTEHRARERVDVTYYRQGQAQHGEVTLGSGTQ
jgi:S1-C subfamily serine protease